MPSAVSVRDCAVGFFQLHRTNMDCFEVIVRSTRRSKPSGLLDWLLRLGILLPGHRFPAKGSINGVDSAEKSPCRMAFEGKKKNSGVE